MCGFKKIIEIFNGGYDRILNEYIRSTIDQCIDIYVKLFNLVFDSGFFPECWTVGIIKPLYKNKGDPFPSI
jgi:hypothetical protein